MLVAEDPPNSTPAVHEHHIKNADVIGPTQSKQTRKQRQEEASFDSIQHK